MGFEFHFLLLAWLVTHGPKQKLAKYVDSYGPVISEYSHKSHMDYVSLDEDFTFHNTQTYFNFNL